MKENKIEYFDYILLWIQEKNYIITSTNYENNTKLVSFLMENNFGAIDVVIAVEDDKDASVYANIERSKINLERIEILEILNEMNIKHSFYQIYIDNEDDEDDIVICGNYKFYGDISETMANFYLYLYTLKENIDSLYEKISEARLSECKTTTRLDDKDELKIDLDNFLKENEDELKIMLEKEREEKELFNSVVESISPVGVCADENEFLYNVDEIFDEEKKRYELNHQNNSEIKVTKDDNNEKLPVSYIVLGIVILIIAHTIVLAIAQLNALFSIIYSLLAIGLVGGMGGAIHYKCVDDWNIPITSKTALIISVLIFSGIFAVSMFIISFFQNLFAK